MLMPWVQIRTHERKGGKEKSLEPNNNNFKNVFFRYLTKKVNIIREQQSYPNYVAQSILFHHILSDTSC